MCKPRERSSPDAIRERVQTSPGLHPGYLLVEKPSTRDPNELMGRTENMRYVNFAGDARMIGQFVDVQISQVMANSLRGRVVMADVEVA